MPCHDPRAAEIGHLVRLGHRAIAVLDGLAAQPELVRDRDSVVATCLQVQHPDVSAVLHCLADWGWLESRSPQGRILLAGAGDLRSLGQRIRGHLEASRGAALCSSVLPIVTLPATSKALVRQLGDGVGMFATRDGFTHVSAQACRRLVFLAPFIDGAGAESLCEMTERSPAPDVTVIVRPDARSVRHYMKFLPELAQAGARVREYWLERPEDGTVRPETFHAKVVLADDNLVYVGSSNLMASSLDGGLECGVILHGEAVRPFRRLVEAVLAVSVPVPVPQGST